MIWLMGQPGSVQANCSSGGKIPIAVADLQRLIDHRRAITFHNVLRHVGVANVEVRLEDQDDLVEWAGRFRRARTMRRTCHSDQEEQTSQMTGQEMWSALHGCTVFVWDVVRT